MHADDTGWRNMLFFVSVHVPLSVCESSVRAKSDNYCSKLMWPMRMIKWTDKAGLWWDRAGNVKKKTCIRWSSNIAPDTTLNKVLSGVIYSRCSLLQQQVARRRTSAVPMAFSVYVLVRDVMVCLTAPTPQMNSTAVSRELIPCTVWCVVFFCRCIIAQ